MIDSDDEITHNVASIVEQGSEPVALVLPGCRYAYVNEAFAAVAHVDRRKMIGHPVAEFVNREIVVAQVRDVIDRAFSGTSATLTLAGLDRTDESRTHQVTCTPLRDASGRVAHVVCRLREAQAIVDMEAELGVVRERLETLAESVPYGMAISEGALQTIVYATPLYDEIFGRAVGESVGRDSSHIAEILHESQRDELANKIRSAVARREKSLVVTFRLADSIFEREKWIQSASSYRYDEEGNLIKSYIIAHDVTEERKLAEQLEKSRTHLQRLLSNIDIGVVIHGPDTRITEANSRACVLLGMSRDQLLGRDSINVDWPFVREDGSTMPVAEYPVNLVRERNEGISDYVVGIRWDTDEETTWVLVTAYPDTDRSGALEQIVVSFIDITRLKRIQEELGETVRTRDRFIDVISHDLRNPMLALETGVNMLSLTDGEYDSDTQQIIRRELGINTTRARELLDNLLLWAQTQRGSLPFRPAPLDLHVTVEATRELLGIAATRKGQNLVNAVRVGTTVHADREMLASVLRNLISNAVKFTPGGGTITVASRDLDGAVEVSVSDTGVGIDAAAQEQLFEPDLARHSTGTDGEKGSGLGLSICNDFVRRHGGVLRVESRAGEGATFLFSLPSGDDPTQ